MDKWKCVVSDVDMATLACQGTDTDIHVRQTDRQTDTHTHTHTHHPAAVRSMALLSNNAIISDRK